MGKIEKLVVLAVLLVSAIVVGVSLYGSGDQAVHEQPFGANDVAAAEGRGGADVERAAQQPLAPLPPHSYIRDETWDSNGRQAAGGAVSDPLAPAPVESDLLLSASSSSPKVSEAASAAGQRAPFDEAGRPLILLSDADVTETHLPSYVLYEVQVNDTWTNLARRLFVGGTKHRGLLQAQNEGVLQLMPGLEIAVPVYDFAALSSTRTPHDAREVSRETVPVTNTDAATSKTQPITAAKQTPGVLKDGWYVVVEGDTLSDISKTVYGTATRWREIYNANKTRMSGPNWVDVGVRLMIP